jgi:hypothetical protein
MPWPLWQGKVVEREGPHTGNSRNEADRPGNVVRFPRDWFGPPDELVPIGRAAHPPKPSEPPPPQDGPPHANDWTGWADDGVLVPLTPGNRDPGPPATRTRTAADFWGEDSATVHDALQAPPPEEAGSAAPGRRAGIGGHRRPGRRLLAAPAFVALALALVATSVYVAARQDNPGAPRSPQARSHTRAAATTAAGREGTILAASVLEAARHASHPAPLHVTAVRAHPTSFRSHHTVPAATATPSPAVAQPPPVSTPAAPASTPSVSDTSAPAAPSGNSATQAGASQAGASQAGASQAGPTGPASAFGPGY